MCSCESYRTEKYDIFQYRKAVNIIYISQEKALDTVHMARDLIALGKRWVV